MEDRIAFLCSSIRTQFTARTEVEGSKTGTDFGISLKIERRKEEVSLTFQKGEELHAVSFPVPFERKGVKLISSNGVERALCDYFDPHGQDNGEILDYVTVMYRIFCGDPSGIIPSNLVKKGPYIQRIVYGFNVENASNVIYNLQRAINEVVSRMPVHETDMNSYVMNSRVIFIDQTFDMLDDPKDRLAYQVEKNRKYFSWGWTSIGLSDGTLADKNYMLRCDLRKITPFGLKHHNPQRNLYSTLGMKGDELPKVRTKTMQKLMDKGLTRKGWNLTTAFMDIPDVFEDQIMVDKSLAAKFINYNRRYICYGRCLVEVGQKLKYKQALSETEDGEKILMDTVADEAEVESIHETETACAGTPVKVFNVNVKYRRYLKDGTKITNMHGNKGVIRLKDSLGYAVDPRTGEKRKLDVIVSATSVKKRKNFGQILEALANECYGEDVPVFPDHAMADMETMRPALKSVGLPEDGALELSTYAGNGKGIVGTVFWGVTKDAEDQLWDRNDTIRKNGRNLRTAGLKFSTVEFRALNTRFGKDNPILDEVLSYSQGSDDLHEQIAILQSKRGELPKNKPTLDMSQVQPLIQENGTMFSDEDIPGTVVDEFFHPDGFNLRLPLPYQSVVDQNDLEITEGIPQEVPNTDKIKAAYNLHSIYIPSSNLRKCWRHDSGYYGLSDVGVLVNHLVMRGQRYLENPQDSNNISMFYMALRMYFERIAGRMGTKRGEISVHGMAVRYPYSAKAVATLSNDLPKNTIEIHRSMADRLRVNNGDIVIAERFPCLGFMSIRPQAVKITDDPLCRYTIRVSGNCLGSMSLDFDGDVLFIASFHTKEAKEALRKEWTNPNPSCYDVIKELNKKAGAPHFSSLSLEDYSLKAFDELTADSHAVLVKRATGVKSHTGPVIALAYNIMRILENSDIKDNQKTNVAVEEFLDRVGNSVFKQKHGVKSLHDIVIDAICTGDVKTLVENGFARGTSTIICNVIRQKGLELGVRDIASYHQWAVANGRSKLINRIVRAQNRMYFASRAALSPCQLLSCLESEEVDWPSKMLKWVLSGKAEATETELDKHLDEKHGVGSIKDENIRSACSSIWAYMKEMLTEREKRSKCVSRPLSRCTPLDGRKSFEEIMRRYSHG